MKKFDDTLNELMKNQDFKNEYDTLDPEYQVIRGLVKQEMPFGTTKNPTDAAGILSKYADISKRKLEKGAFERSIIDKYKNN